MSDNRLTEERQQQLISILTTYRQSANRGFQERVAADLEAVVQVEALYDRLASQPPEGEVVPEGWAVKWDVIDGHTGRSYPRLVPIPSESKEPT